MSKKNQKLNIQKVISLRCWIGSNIFQKVQKLWLHFDFYRHCDPRCKKKFFFVLISKFKTEWMLLPTLNIGHLMSSTPHSIPWKVHLSPAFKSAFQKFLKVKPFLIACKRRLSRLSLIFWRGTHNSRFFWISHVWQYVCKIGSRF